MRMMFHVSYTLIHVLMFLIIVKMKFWTERESDVPTSSRKQLQPSALVFTSDSETGTEEEENSEPESSDDKISDT